MVKEEQEEYESRNVIRGELGSFWEETRDLRERMRPGYEMRVGFERDARRAKLESLYC
jgi:hypothetical protein